MDERIRQTDLPSVAALAYIGDAVHGLDIRRRAVAQGL
jgi:23S rRNA maturation mini-RNase III